MSSYSSASKRSRVILPLQMRPGSSSEPPWSSKTTKTCSRSKWILQWEDHRLSKRKPVRCLLNFSLARWIYLSMAIVVSAWSTRTNNNFCGKAHSRWARLGKRPCPVYHAWRKLWTRRDRIRSCGRVTGIVRCWISWRPPQAPMVHPRARCHTPKTKVVTGRTDKIRRCCPLNTADFSR